MAILAVELNFLTAAGSRVFSGRTLKCYFQNKSSSSRFKQTQQLCSLAFLYNQCFYSVKDSRRCVMKQVW